MLPHPGMTFFRLEATRATQPIADHPCLATCNTGKKGEFAVGVCERDHDGVRPSHECCHCQNALALLVVQVVQVVRRLTVAVPWLGRIMDSRPPSSTVQRHGASNTNAARTCVIDARCLIVVLVTDADGKEWYSTAGNVDGGRDAIVTVKNTLVHASESGSETKSNKPCMDAAVADAMSLVARLARMLLGLRLSFTVSCRLRSVQTLCQLLFLRASIEQIGLQARCRWSYFISL